MYAGPEDGHARTIHQTLVRSDNGPMREHHIPQTRQALDYHMAGDGVRHAAAVRARIVRGAVVPEGGPLVGVEAWREVGVVGCGFVRADGHVLLVRC